jgi:hypothetical protein
MTHPAFADIVPTREGILNLVPTLEIRWFIEAPVTGKPKVLQQLWRDVETGAPYWRDVPTVTGRRG